MKQKLLIMIAAMLLVPMGLFSQTYQELWKQVEQAQKKDLPKTAMEHLQAEVAPDSLLPAVKRLEQEAAHHTKGRG